jgi:hypothetical protein
MAQTKAAAIKAENAATRATRGAQKKLVRAPIAKKSAGAARDMAFLAATPKLSKRSVSRFAKLDIRFIHDKYARELAPRFKWNDKIPKILYNFTE